MQEEVKMKKALLAAAVLAVAPVALSYTPVGEILSGDSSASFDSAQVVGPQVSLTREAKGRWVGRLKGTVIDVTEVKDGVRGANVALYVERLKDGYIVRGNLGDRTVHVHVP